MNAGACLCPVTLTLSPVFRGPARSSLTPSGTQCWVQIIPYTLLTKSEWSGVPVGGVLVGAGVLGVLGVGVVSRGHGLGR